MPATLTTSSLAATITQVTLKDAIKTAMTAVGFSSPLYDNVPTADHVLIYEDITQPGFTKEKVFIRVTISTTLVVNVTIGDGYTGGSSTILSASISNSYTFLPGQPIDFAGFVSSGSYRLLALSQGSSAAARLLIGYIIPEQLQTWANKNTYMFAYLPNPGFGSFYGPNNIINGTANISLSAPNVSGINPWTGGREIIGKIHVFNNSSSAFVGLLPSDFFVSAANGLVYADTLVISTGVEEYRLLNAANGGICIRTV